MNKRYVWMLLLSEALIAVAPMAMAGSIPLPSRPPKGVSQSSFKFMRQQLAGIKQFDLTAMGIPVERSLRLAGAAGDPSHPFVLDAVSPRNMESMLGWYRNQLPGWRVTHHTKGAAATLTSMQQSGYRVVIMRCIDGTFQLYACGSVVRIYKMPESENKHVQIVPGKANNPHKAGKDDAGKGKNNIIKKDARNIGKQTVEDAHQSVKQGVQNGIDNKVHKGVGHLLHKLFGGN